MTAREWEEQYLTAKFGVIPTACPACGSLRIVRVIWQRASYGGPIKSIVEAGKGVLAGDGMSATAPAWACLDCQPGWLNVHQLSLDDEELQLQKEDAVARMDFMTAKQYLNTQVGIRQRQGELLGTLLKPA